jgi:hypothetical protein
MTKKAKTGRSLVEYDRAKRRAACAVCSLPEAVRGQIRGASERKIRQALVVEWLREEHHIKIARQEFVAHGAAHHDTWDEEEGS